MSENKKAPTGQGKGEGVLVIGSLNMDLVVRVQSHPRPGETVLGSDVETFPGGKGANQAAAAARAAGGTQRVRMLGRVGSDAYGAALRSALRAAGVDVGPLLRSDGPSGMAFITVDTSGENMIVVSPGANGRLQPDDLPAELLADAAVVLMQLEIPLATVARAAALAREAGARVVLNAAPAQALDDALLQQLAVLVVNESEAALLSGLPVHGPELAASATAAAAALRSRGVEAVVVTLGEHGAVWLGPDGGGMLPAATVEVIDTTAAGDAFCGALASRLAEGASLADAVAFANAAGALATTRAGAQPSLPDRHEIAALLGR